MTGKNKRRMRPCAAGKRAVPFVLALVMMLTSVPMSGVWAVAGEIVVDDSEETIAYLVADDGTEIELSEQELEELRATSLDEIPTQIDAVLEGDFADSADPSDLTEDAGDIGLIVDEDDTSWYMPEDEDASGSMQDEEDPSKEEGAQAGEITSEEEGVPEEGAQDEINAPEEDAPAGEELEGSEGSEEEEIPVEEAAEADTDVFGASDDDGQAEDELSAGSQADENGEDGPLGGGNAEHIDIPALTESFAFLPMTWKGTSTKAASVGAPGAPVNSSYYNVNITQSGNTVRVSGTIASPYAFYGLFVDTDLAEPVTGSSVNTTINMSNYATGYHTVIIGLIYTPDPSSYVDMIGRKYMVSNNITARPSYKGRFEVYSKYFNFYPYNIGMQNTDGDLYMEYKTSKAKTWKRSGYMRSNLIELLPTQGYKISGLKAMKTYKTRIRYGTFVTYSKDLAGDGKQHFFGGPTLKTATIKTGSAKKPPIRSVTAKAVNVKYHKVRHYGKYTGVYLYTEKFYTCKIKVTINMKKKPGTKGLFVNDRWLKGNKKVYTTTFSPYPNYYFKHPRGSGKFTVSVRSGQSKNWGGYSPTWSKTKRLS